MLQIGMTYNQYLGQTLKKQLRLDLVSFEEKTGVGEIRWYIFIDIVCQNIAMV